jgi:phospholipid/cholesterol/gamma-HCH transport system substrate-binding protein
VSPPPALGSAVVTRRIAGIAFLLIVAMLVGLTVLLYQKAFTPVVKVSLQTDRIGNQLTAHSDVKLRGLIVGEVRDIRSEGNGATITLALQPDKVDLIPKDVRAQLLPKTLFGEKYVDLSDPNSGAAHIRAGDVIDQDHSSTAVETERVLDNLLPLLKSLNPQDLSMTLNALSTALRGRGNELGSNLVRTAAYLKQLNPTLPTLQADMQGLADLANNTADATPNLLATLDNLSASSRNLVQEQPSLDAFLKTTTAFATTTQSIVAENESRLVALARDSIPSLQLYGKYATEFPCLAKGLSDYNPIIDRAFGGAQSGLHINVELTDNMNGYATTDTPKYLDSRAPYCSGLPTPPVPAKDERFADGYHDSSEPVTAPQGYLSVRSSGAEQSKAVINSVAAPLLGVGADQVPDIASVLVAPVAQGNALGLA